MNIMNTLRYTLASAGLILLNLAHAWNTPSYSSPGNGSTVSTSVTLDWGVVQNSEAYQCQLDTSPNFDSPLLRSVTNPYANGSDGNFDTRTTHSGLRFGAVYRWRIRAYVAGDTSAWSTPRIFTTTDLVTITSPGLNTTVFTAMRMNWQPSSGVAFYDAQLDTSAAFNSPLLRTISNPYANSSDGNSDTQWDVTQLRFGTVYHWRVRARHANDTSAWNGRVFTTSDQVTLDSPAPSANLFVAPRLNWSPHNGVSFYDAEVDTTVAFNSPLLQQITHQYANTADGNYDTEWTVQPLRFGTSHHWRVRVRNTVDTSAWTSRSFNTLDHISLSWPANLALNMPVAGITLDWAPFTGITYYQVQVDTTPLFSSDQLMEALNPYANSLDGNFDTRYDTPALLEDQVYFWRVRALHNTDTSAWTTRIFTTGSALQMPQVPELIAPANLSTVNEAQPSLTWMSGLNATTYDIQYGPTADLSAATTLNSTSTQLPTAALLPGDVVFWRVRARNASLVSEWSSTWQFTYEPSTSVPNEEETMLVVFPNPNQGIFTISGTSSGDFLRIITTTGQVIHEQAIRGEVPVRIEMSKLPVGSYLLEVKSMERTSVLRLMRE